MPKKLIEKICKTLYVRVKDDDFLQNSKKKLQDFTRNRKLSFSDNVILILNKTGKGLRSGIRAFLETMKKETESYSVQAFSKGRMRIKYEAFIELFRITVDMFYQEADYKKFNGYRVTAIDGMKADLPYHEDTLREFGCQKSNNDQIQALSSCLYDVLNHIIIDAEIAPCNAFEGDLARQHIDHLASISTSKELIIFDRGYPSAALIDFIQSKGLKYLFRYNKTFLIGAKDKITSDDCVISYCFKKSGITLKMRVITITLPDGKQENLVTNIFDEFTKTDFEELYHMRWRIETNYNDIKNKLEVENFSGVTPLAIKQDFFATMILKNLAAVMIYSNQEEVNAAHNSSGNIYHYKSNVNTVVSLLKTDLIYMLTLESKSKRRKLWKKITFVIVHSVVPIRPNRSFPRFTKHPTTIFYQNHRS